MKAFIVIAISIFVLGCSKNGSSETQVQQPVITPIENPKPEDEALPISKAEVVAIKKELLTNSSPFSLSKSSLTKKALVAGAMLDKAIKNLGLDKLLVWDDLNEKNIQQLTNIFFDENYNLKK